jgi:hypothetical protein
MKNTTPLAMALLLSACAATPPDPNIKAAANAPVYCPDKPACDAAWAKAEVWVAQNSRFRIQRVSSVVLSTYGPSTAGGATTNLAFQVTRESIGGDRQQIKVWAGCGNPFGCIPTVDEATAALKRHISPGHP